MNSQLAEGERTPLTDQRLNALRKANTEAGIVPQGVESGARMHQARHTAGQRVLDRTGNLKAAQALLGHASIQTTADVYTDWDEAALAATMGLVLEDDE